MNADKESGNNFLAALSFTGQDATPGRAASTAAPVARGPRWRVWRDQLFPISTAASDLPAMDGLRAVAISLVFLYHVRGPAMPAAATWLHGQDSAPISVFGQMGVLLFFVLSGFLLFLPYARALTDPAARWPDLWTFYRRRALRILPAYWTAVILIAFLVEPGWLWIKRIWHVISHLTFLYTFTPDTLHSLNGPFWSLGIEVQFYLLLPFLALSMAALGRRIGGPGRAVGLVIAGIAALALAWRWWWAVVMDPVVGSQRGDYRFYLEQLPSLGIIFALGMGCSYLWVRYGATPAGRRGLLAGAGGLLGVAGVIYAMSLGAVTLNIPAAQRDFTNRVGWDLLAAGAWALVILAVLFGPRWGRALLSWWPLRALSLISYSFYIWHDVINRGLTAYIQEQYTGGELILALTAVLFPLCCFFALGYFHFVEWPYLRRKHPGPPVP